MAPGSWEGGSNWRSQLGLGKGSGGTGAVRVPPRGCGGARPGLRAAEGGGGSGRAPRPPRLRYVLAGVCGLGTGVVNWAGGDARGAGAPGTGLVEESERFATRVKYPRSTRLLLFGANEVGN